MCAALAAALQELLGADQVHQVVVAQGGSSADVAIEDPIELALDGRPSATARVLREDRSYAVPDTRAAADLRPDLVERFNAASALFVPLRWGDEIRRVVVALWHSQREIPAADVALAELLADQAAAGLARVEADERRAAGSIQDRAVVRAAAALNASLDLQEVLRTLAHEAANALGADVSGVYLGDAERGAIATAGHGMPDDWHGLRMGACEGACGHALVTGRPFATQEYGGEIAGPEARVLSGVRSAVAVPMAWNDELKGAIAVGWTARRRIHDEDVRTLEAIAGIATAACHNAEAYERVQRAARTDALTGLLNHGAMQVRIREEIARADRDKAPLACVILDLDDFKRVNDTRGHQAGDELLREVAAAISRELRPYDQVARYGGDEFVLLLPGSDEQVAAQVAERVRESIGGACSIGVAAWQEGSDADGLIEQADRALMLAKRTGKGRVAIANAEVERELALLHSRRGSPEAVQALAAAIEQRDSYTRTHSEEVVRLARGVAMLLGLHADQVERVAHAALLHDVGKLGVPHEILDKPGPLSRDEWRVIAEHPVVGERILMRINQLAGIAAIVRHEHEHWDGSGYPDGLQGQRIPVGSRIILACDAYNAMISERPYRAALSQAEAVEELRRSAGRQFDPEIIEALLELLEVDRPPTVDRARGVRLPPPPPRPPGRTA